MRAGRTWWLSVEESNLDRPIADRVVSYRPSGV